MTLNQLQTGQRARIEEVSGEGALRKHLLDMGMIPGAEVTLTQFAPMGDPMEIRIHGYALTLRLSEAEKIRIHPLDDAAEPQDTGADENRANRNKESRVNRKESHHPGWEKKGNFIRRAAAIRSRRARHYHLLWWATRTAAKRPCSTS